MIENNQITWAERSESLGKFAPAFLKLQSELEPVKKDAANPFFKSKYAELSSILEAVQPLLTKFEFILIQEPGNLENMLALTTTIMHVSGEYIRSSVAFPVVKQDPQGYGSAITYARRYTLQSIIGLPVTDDDGSAASGLSHKTTVTNKATAPKTNQPMATPRPADNLPPKANSGAWDGNLLITGGKYKDKRWKDLPPDYLEWARHNAKSKDAQRMSEQEINRREAALMPDFEAINDEAETKRILREEASIEDTY